MTAPRENAAFVGHRAAVASLYSAATSGRLHHAWLIGGPSGVGKTTLAYRFARWLLAGGKTKDLSVDPGHPAFKRVAAATHADLFTVEKRYSEKLKRVQSIIAVDTVREIKNFFHHTAGEGGWRIVVVEDADNMTASAQNALLKGLEEPPKRGLMLLVSDAPARLLPTTRSRCRQITLMPLTEAEVETVLRAQAPELSRADAARIARLSEGSIGLALTLAEENGVAIAGLVDEVLAGAVAPARAQSVADTLARSEDGYEVFMSLLRSGLAAGTRAAARRNQAGLSRRVGLWEEFGKLERDVQNLNLDKRAAIIVALNQLHGS